MQSANQMNKQQANEVEIEMTRLTKVNFSNELTERASHRKGHCVDIFLVVVPLQQFTWMFTLSVSHFYHPRHNVHLLSQLQNTVEALLFLTIDYITRNALERRLWAMVRAHALCQTAPQQRHLMQKVKWSERYKTVLWRTCIVPMCVCACVWKCSAIACSMYICVIGVQNRGNWKL